jgi:hypothetical protein
VIKTHVVLYDYDTQRFYLTDQCQFNAKNIIKTLEGMITADGDYVLTLKEAPLKPKLEFGLTRQGTPLSFKFTDMSHRARLITGFYDFDFPDDYLEKWISPSAPLVGFGDVLYLMSNNGNVIHSANAQNPSILFRMHNVFRYQQPLILQPRKDQRDEVIADATSTRELRLKLVDRWLQPVKILNPMVITIKMKPVKEDVPTYG